ncbi:MAG: hypothetical protein ACLSB9_00195 [Hydrogeniiclostridium mannosilyticum]
MLDGDPVAVVDTGWTGSIQRSLRQLLRSAGGNGGISGFCFGLYQEPKDPADGDYMAWYFSGVLRFMTGFSLTIMCWKACVLRRIR